MILMFLQGFGGLIETVESRFCGHIETTEAASVVSLKPQKPLS
jgi:hypothetical protein